MTPKGPVFQAAILAGIMGAKRTAELIPLCHPLALDDCQIEIEARAPRTDGSVEVEVHCRAQTEARTGVEMEALTGRQRRRAHPLRHGQGGHPRDRDPGDPPAGEDRRQEGLPGAVNKTVRVRYFAILREQRGLDEETVDDRRADRGRALRGAARAPRLHASARAAARRGQRRFRALDDPSSGTGTRSSSSPRSPEAEDHGFPADRPNRSSPPSSWPSWATRAPAPASPSRAACGTRTRAGRSRPWITRPTPRSPKRRERGSSARPGTGSRSWGSLCVHRTGSLALGDVAVWVARHRRAPRGRLRGLPLHHRRGQGAAADLEEGALCRTGRPSGSTAPRAAGRARAQANEIAVKIRPWPEFASARHRRLPLLRQSHENGLPQRLLRSRPDDPRQAEGDPAGLLGQGGPRRPGRHRHLHHYSEGIED